MARFLRMFKVHISSIAIETERVFTEESLHFLHQYKMVAKKITVKERPCLSRKTYLFNQFFVAAVSGPILTRGMNGKCSAELCTNKTFRKEREIWKTRQGAR